MKITMKVLLTLALLANFGLAGDQGTGGYVPCDPNVEVCPAPPPLDCTENCNNNSAMMSGGGGSENAFSFVLVAEAIEMAVEASFARG